METWSRNVRTGLRSLRRTPAFTSSAILTLALGIGLATAVFTVARAVLLRPLPVVDQDRLVVLHGAMRDGSFDRYPLTLANAHDFVGRSGALADAGFYGYEGAWPTPVRADDGVVRLRRAVVSGEFFPALGVRPVLGRTLRPEDDVLGAAPVVVISYRLWQHRFAGAGDVLGRGIVLNATGVRHAIVGVMPPFDFPQGVDFWAPIVPARGPEAEPAATAVHIVGRLAPGGTAAQARDDLTDFFARPQGAPFERDLRGVAESLHDRLVGETGAAVLVFAAAAGLLLLITCINVASLLVARGAARIREIAVRTALGAGRTRIVGQLVTENVLLAAAGGALGLLIAIAAIRTFTRLAPPDVPRLAEITVDPAVLAAAVLISGLACLLFGILPAVLTTRTGIRDLLGSGARHGPGRRTRRATEALVAGQVALAVVILAFAGLLARSLVRLETADLAFDSDDLLIAELAIEVPRHPDLESQLALIARTQDAVRAVPGVRALSPVVAVPYSGSGGWDGRPTAEGQTPAQVSENPVLNLELVAPDYFATLDVPLLDGRAFTPADRDGAPAVVLLSASAARHFWPDGDPVGRRLFMDPAQERPLTVVGIVPDTRYRDLRDARPSIYFPIAQSFFPYAPTILAIRTRVPPATLVPAIRAAVRSEPGVDIAAARPFRRFLDGPLAQPRLNAFLLATFAGAALLLAAVGLFGIVATTVRRQTRELGIRMALGATPGRLQRMLVHRGLRIAGIGALFGLAAALAASRLFASLLYEIRPTDPATLSGVTLLLLGCAVLASLLPARSVLSIDPLRALRADE